MNFNTINEAVTAIRNGGMVVVVDDEGRENEGDLVIAAKHATPKAVNFMVTYGRGLVCAPVSMEIAGKLGLSPMIPKNGDPMGTAFTISIDHKDATTGISAADRALTISYLAEPEASKKGITMPGHVFPLIAADGGVLGRSGHTEAAVDLARIAGLAPAAAICEILKDDGSMARSPQLFDFAERHNLKIISVNELTTWRKNTELFITRDSVAGLPTEYGEFRMFTYLHHETGEHHIALVKGDPSLHDKPVLVRIHSECLTGDVFHSIRCDCGTQLSKALISIQKEPCGVLVYLRQEGRGIGLPDKMKAYVLQEQGYDTVEANIALGYAPDLRNYGVAARILEDLGVRRVQLMTNNPDKISGLEKYGVEVICRIPLLVTPNAENKNYLAVKEQRMGHMLT